MLGTGRFVGSGAGVAGCFVAGDAGLVICSGLGSVASEELTVGDGLGRRVAVGVGFAVRVGRRVGVAAPMGPDVLEQANDASKPVRISANARNFPGINLGPRPY